MKGSVVALRVAVRNGKTPRAAVGQRVVTEAGADNRAMRSKMIDALVNDHALDRVSALSVVNHLLGMLNTPDRYMLGAGMSELAIGWRFFSDWHDKRVGK